LCKSGEPTDEEEEENRNQEPPNFARPTKSIGGKSTVAKGKDNNENKNSSSGRTNGNTRKKSSDVKGKIHENGDK